MLSFYGDIELEWGMRGEKTGKAKLDQAKKFGTKVITEGEMEAMLAAG